MKNYKSLKGRHGEDLVSTLLIKQGFEIIARRLRLSGLAEIDILARRESSLWLFEVKTHENPVFGSLISSHQLERLQKTKAVMHGLYPSYNIKIFLVWTKLSSRRVELFEIP